MANDSPREVTILLRKWRDGDAAAIDRLMPLVYAELQRLAHRYMIRERAGHTLQTTALVNEAYLRLIDAKSVDWKDRAHFFAISANLMRRVLVELARAHDSHKRGGDVRKVELDEALIPSLPRGRDIVALDDALSRLQEVDPRKAKVVELRFFGGLSVEETADVVGVSIQTVMREWETAKVWLLHHLKHQDRADAHRVK